MRDIYSDELNRKLECEECGKLLGYVQYHPDGWELCVDCYDYKVKHLTKEKQYE